MSRQYHPDTARDLKVMVAKIGSQLLAVENLASVLGMPRASTDRLTAAREILPEVLRTIDANTKPTAPDDLSTLTTDGTDDTPPHGIARPTDGNG